MVADEPQTGGDVRGTAGGGNPNPPAGQPPDTTPPATNPPVDTTPPPPPIVKPPRVPPTPVGPYNSRLLDYDDFLSARGLYAVIPSQVFPAGGTANYNGVVKFEMDNDDSAAVVLDLGIDLTNAGLALYGGTTAPGVSGTITRMFDEDNEPLGGTLTIGGNVDASRGDLPLRADVNGTFTRDDGNLYDSIITYEAEMRGVFIGEDRQFLDGAIVNGSASGPGGAKTGLGGSVIGLQF